MKALRFILPLLVILAADGQPDALLATKHIVGRGLAPAEKHAADLDNTLYG